MDGFQVLFSVKNTSHSKDLMQHIGSEGWCKDKFNDVCMIVLY